MQVLDLTSIPIVSEHLEGLHGPVIFDEDGLNHVRPSKLETLILDGTKIDDEAMIPLQNLSKLKALHIAETRISRTSNNRLYFARSKERLMTSFVIPQPSSSKR